MSGPALNPLANIATTAKSADLPRTDGTAASGADAADTGFSRELQRQIDRDTKPAGTPTGSPPATSGKTTNEKSADSKAATAADATPKDTAADSQATSPDVAALLGSLLTTGTGSPSSRQIDDEEATPPQESLPAATDAALAALIATGQRPAAASPSGTVTLASEQTDAIADESDLDLTAGGRHPRATTMDIMGGELLGAPYPINSDSPPGRNQLTRIGVGDIAGGPQSDNLSPDLANSTIGRQALADPATGNLPLEAALTDSAAKLAASGETAGKRPELTTETATVNAFAGIHAAALANLRGESPAQVASPVPLHVATPAGSPGWPEEVGSRVSWMVGHEESHAQLTLTPPQLGKIEVSITVSGDQTSAQFVAATPAARELIEQSLPRLREVLEQSGINLGQTDVGTSGQSNNSGEGQRGKAWGDQRGADDGTTPRVAAQQWVRRGDGLVDTFA